VKLGIKLRKPYTNYKQLLIIKAPPSTYVKATSFREAQDQTTFDRLYEDGL